MEPFSNEELFYVSKIFKHKEALILAFNTLVKVSKKDIIIHRDLVNSYDRIRRNIIRHDIDKFSNIRVFDAYRCRNFRNEFDSKELIRSIPDSVENHRLINEHHFDYWRDMDFQMPGYAMIECACDWFGCSLIEPQKGNPLEWWASVEDEMRTEFGEWVDFDYIITAVKLLMGV
ncbi:MAG: DUF5662 family protein [Cetobacterium sp.]